MKNNPIHNQVSDDDEGVDDSFIMTRTSNQDKILHHGSSTQNTGDISMNLAPD